VYCSRGGLTRDEINCLLTDKHPSLRYCSKSWNSINYEFELPSILCYRVGMLTVEHKYVLDAIERTYILKDHTFADLDDRDLRNKLNIETMVVNGKDVLLVSLHIDLVKLFKIKSSDMKIGSDNDCFPFGVARAEISREGGQYAAERHI